MPKLERLLIILGELSKELAVLLFVSWVEKRKKKKTTSKRKPSE